MLNLWPVSLVGLMLSDAVLTRFVASDELPATATSAVQPDSSPIDAINRAENPSAAIEAYAHAIAAQPKSTAVGASFLNRMVDLGVPAMAEAQANDLILRDPDNGRAWAVAAYVNGRRGASDAALAQIQTAAKRAPEDPFVQHTAGQLLAYFDANPDAAAQTPEAVMRDLPQLRNAMAGKETFEGSYREARDAYRADDQNPNPSTTSTTTSTSSTTNGDINDAASPASPSPRVYDDSIIGNESLVAPNYTPVYVEPYYVPVYPSYRHSYWPWWCDTTTSIIVIRDRDRHHHRGGGHDSSRDWDRDGGRRWRDRDRDGDRSSRGDESVLVPRRNRDDNSRRNREDNRRDNGQSRAAPFVPSRPDDSATASAGSNRRPQAQPSAGAQRAPQARPAAGAQRPTQAQPAAGPQRPPQAQPAAGPQRPAQAQPAPAPRRPEARPAGPQRPSAQPSAGSNNRGGGRSDGAKSGASSSSGKSGGSSGGKGGGSSGGKGGKGR